ncbi:MAG: hypothetical protein KDB96_10120 [Flavobacteriales bacterium]|nr:hypothetical protein [Flavobacteriales bacterium]MCB0809623.1 hypothetical protein [Flavobacteriales bacterium]MCB9181805.1 hypothetical protein [Flavobacteriales bacterium]HPQ58709.1 hypothetical protein [Flavobacteriales bacterium]HRW89180.1 hypothetical protein [Flavobacteriales bacterium]
MKTCISSFAILFAFGTNSFAAPADLPEGPGSPPAEREVQVTAWLQAFELSYDDITVQVEYDGAAETVGVNDRGRFNVTLPADVEAVLRFEKPGHVTKEVIVDTRHVAAGDFDERVRKVSFGVVLEPERHMADQVYAGPVGTIGFDADGGCLAVEEHRELAPGRKRATMVF